MRSLLHPLAAALAVAVSVPIPSAAAQGAPTAPADSGFQLRVGGDIDIPAGGREGAVVVIRGAARVAGTVGALVVLDGSATITGGRIGELIVMRGHARLEEHAVVTGDVHLLDAGLETVSGARVEGTVERGAGRQLIRDAFAVFALLSLGVLAAIVLAAVIAALVAPAALITTGQLMRAEPGRVAGVAALAWLAGPIAAVLLIPTVIGLPIGLGYLLFVLPVLAFVGMVVSGSWLGDVLYRQVAGRPARPVAAAALGVTFLVVLSRVPLLGILAAFVSIAGAGAVLLACVRTARRNSLRD